MASDDDTHPAAAGPESPFEPKSGDIVLVQFYARVREVYPHDGLASVRLITFAGGWRQENLPIPFLSRVPDADTLEFAVPPASWL